MDAQHESRVKALRELRRASDHMHLEMGKINRLVNEHAEKQQVLAVSRDSTLPPPHLRLSQGAIKLLVLNKGKIHFMGKS